jgi:cysteine-rich repeat protein
VLAALALFVSTVLPAAAVDYVGTVDFQGDVTFSAPIAGISEQDLTVSVKPETEATGQATKCSITATSSDAPDVTGNYPDAGSVDASYLVERGGPNLPEGTCVTTVVATGTDGISVSARGSQVVFVDVNDVDASGNVVVPTITVRQSKAIAGLYKDCAKWLKKQMKKRVVCNFKLLKKGPDQAEKCKDAGPEPTVPELCDPGDFVEAVLAAAHGANDFQTDPLSAPTIDYVMHKDQVKCQKRFGKAAVNFTAKYFKLVDKKCVQAGIDDASCRSAQANTAKKKLDQIDKCVTDQTLDGGSGTLIPEVGDPCMSCIAANVLDRKCMKSCFQTNLIELGDGMVGDVPECGNGILQGGEFCDDGNLVNGDCCSDSCTLEAGSTEGPNGDLTCSDLLDNDCDGDIDLADVDCQ